MKRESVSRARSKGSIFRSRQPRMPSVFSAGATGLSRSQPAGIYRQPTTCFDLFFYCLCSTDLVSFIYKIKLSPLTNEVKEKQMGDSKKDYKASLILGALAAVLSLVTINNLGISESVIARFNLSIPSSMITLIIMAVIFIACPAGIFVARLIGKTVLSLYQLIKFAETGGLNTFVNFGVLNLLMWVTNLSTGIYYSIFIAVAFTAAVINSYLWNKHWVFKSKAKGSSQEKEFAKFVTVSLIGGLITVVSASLIQHFSRNSTNLNPKLMGNIAAAIAFIITMAWNFLGYKLVVFVKPQKVNGKKTEA